MAYLRELTRAEFLGALATAPAEDPVAQACAAALRADPRVTFEAYSAVSAREFAATMRKKFFFARRGGRVVHGGDAFIATLEARGDTDVLGVFTFPPGQVVKVMLDPETLQYVTGYWME